MIAWMRIERSTMSRMGQSKESLLAVSDASVVYMYVVSRDIHCMSSQPSRYSRPSLMGAHVAHGYYYFNIREHIVCQCGEPRKEQLY
jgi:hypothetical protein